jgi:anti-sigma regulatory factor (Ser/Thr protein kinase)
MAIAPAESRSLVVVSLPGTPYSVQRARLYVRTALGCHDLDDYVEDVEAVTSELVSNAVTHTGAHAFGLELLRFDEGSGVVVVVTDPSPLPPIMSHLTEDAEHGRGLRVVDALSARWGSAPQDSGKAVFAIFTREG